MEGLDRPVRRLLLDGIVEEGCRIVGVQFFGSEGLNTLVDGILTATEDEPSNPNTDACNRLPDSAL